MTTLTDRFGAVLGAVSWADLRQKIDVGTTEDSSRLGSWRGVAQLPGQAPDTDDDSDGLSGDIVDEWGRQSFPASDPPANW